MEERLARIIRNINSFEALARFETNAKARDALTDEVNEAIKAQLTELGRAMVAQRTGLDLSDLSPAEEKIVQAVSEYVGLMKREGKPANRTFEQLHNRGLIDAAEAAVSKSKTTQGFKTLVNADLADLSYEQIIVDHPNEFSPRAIWYSRRTLGLPNESDRPPAKAASLTQTRTENLLQWFRERSDQNAGQLNSFANAEAAAALGMNDMHQFGRVFGNIQSRIDFACYLAGLPPLGLAADAPFDKAWRQEDRTWAFPVESMQAAARSRTWTAEDFDHVLRQTEGLPGQAHISWNKEIATDEARVKGWAFGLQDLNVQIAPAEDPYWVFVCNPKKWAIDRFLDRRIDQDTWGVRPSDSDRFAPGQLGIVRVGVDRRSVTERDGRPPLEPGIYALCEVESEAFPGTGASDEFWAPDEAREPGWPTVRLRFLRTYRDKPLTIGRLRAERPSVSSLLLKGFQAASFPISPDDFRAVMELLGEELSELPLPTEQSLVTSDKLSSLEERFIHASPEVKIRLSQSIERGPAGALAKKVTGYKCQLCEALGLDPIGFTKKNGEPYVEAHHVMPVSKLEVGSLAASNIMTLCANHHRQMHYGDVDVVITDETFDLMIGGKALKIPRLGISDAGSKPT